MTTWPVRCRCVNSPTLVEVAGLGAALVDSQALLSTVLPPDFPAAVQKMVQLRAAKNVPAGVRAQMMDMEKELERRGDEMGDRLKKQAIKDAATVTGITLTLSLMGPIGQALGAIVSLINTFSSPRYIKRCKSYAQQQQAMVEQFMKAQEKRLTDAFDAAYKKSFKGAIELAMSNQPLDEVTIKSSDFINPGMYHGNMNGLGFINSITGKSIWTKCKAMVDSKVKHLMTLTTQYVEPQIAKMKTRGFTDLLRTEIARSARQMPGILLYYKHFGIRTPRDNLFELLHPEESYKQAALKKSGAFDVVFKGRDQYTGELSLGAKAAIGAAVVGTAVVAYRTLT